MDVQENGDDAGTFILHHITVQVTQFSFCPMFVLLFDHTRSCISVNLRWALEFWAPELKQTSLCLPALA